MTERLEILTFNQDTSQRLDKFLVASFPEFSRSRLQRLIKIGMVEVNDGIAHKAGQVLDPGDIIKVRIPPPEPSELEPEDIHLDVIYEDGDVLVINKPAGMVVHPAAGHSTGTLVHAALAHAPEMEGIGGVQRPGIVHRLDKNTSGVIIMAKNDRTHRFLQDQFSHRTAKKSYTALVDGFPPTLTGRIEAPIGRHPQHRKKMAIISANKGRQAASEYHTLERFPEHTLLEVKPITGRTHQIRLHTAFIGCPVVGDTIYGRRHPTLPIKRHFLHAASLSILLPGKVRNKTFNAVLPPELEQILANLRNEQLPLEHEPT